MSTNSKTEITGLASDGSFGFSLALDGRIPVPFCNQCLMNCVPFSLRKLICDVCTDEWTKEHANAN